MLRIRRRIERFEAEMIPHDPGPPEIMKVNFVDSEKKAENAPATGTTKPSIRKGEWQRLGFGKRLRYRRRAAAGGNTEDSSHSEAGIQREAETRNASGNKPAGAMERHRGGSDFDRIGALAFLAPYGRYGQPHLLPHRS
jgi:hypothetical protein